MIGKAPIIVATAHLSIMIFSRLVTLTSTDWQNFLAEDGFRVLEDVPITSVVGMEEVWVGEVG